MNKVLKYSLLGLGALSFSSAQAVLIDDFSTDSPFITFTGPAVQTDSNSVNGGGIIGAGDRDLMVEYITGPGINPVDTAAAGTGGGQFIVANGVTSNSIVTLEWNPLGNDLTDGGLAEGLFLSLPNPIDNDLDVSFIINGTSVSNNTFPDGSSGDDFFIPFASFTDPLAAGSANSLQLVLSDGAGWDASIDFVETRPRVPPPPIPVPGTLFLMLTGILGFVGLRIKNKKAA